MSHNMSQPAWVTQRILDKLDELDTFNWDLESWTHEMLRLRAGELVRHLMLNFVRAARPKTTTTGRAIGASRSAATDYASGLEWRAGAGQPGATFLEGAGSKFTMYSAHDSTVSWLTHALGVFNERQPPYACAVFLELYNLSDSGELIVEAHLRNTSDNTIHLLNMPSMWLLMFF